MASSHLLRLSTQGKGGQLWQLAELSPSSFLISFDTNELVCWLFSTYGLKGSLRNVVDSSCSVFRSWLLQLLMPSNFIH